MGHFLQVSHNWDLCKMLGGETLVMARLADVFMCLQMVTERACNHDIHVPPGEDIRKIPDFPAFLAVKSGHMTLYGR